MPPTPTHFFTTGPSGVNDSIEFAANFTDHYLGLGIQRGLRYQI